MTNQQLQQFLTQFPDDMPVKLLRVYNGKEITELTEENILHASETAYVDQDAPEDEWDCEDGKVRLGEGQQYLLFNCMVV